jgi:hypothetical protein
MNVRLECAETDRDYTHYKDKSWLESDYFYPVRLGVVKKAAGRLFDAMAARAVRKRKT